MDRRNRNLTNPTASPKTATETPVGRARSPATSVIDVEQSHLLASTICVTIASVRFIAHRISSGKGTGSSYYSLLSGSKPRIHDPGTGHEREADPPYHLLLAPPSSDSLHQRGFPLSPFPSPVRVFVPFLFHQDSRTRIPFQGLLCPGALCHDPAALYRELTIKLAAPRLTL